MLLKKNYPFPAVATLRSWLKKIKIDPGILKGVFNIMKVSDMSSLDKVCVISFDEIKIKKRYLYDHVNDKTLKPYSYAQVVILRGLFKSWKQPIFYDLDFKLTKEKLFELISFAESSGIQYYLLLLVICLNKKIVTGFQVVAMVSDLGGGNRSLHNELNVNHNNTWFTNPFNGEAVHVFADVPHLVKLIRNHFVDHGFIVKDKEINKTIIEDLLDVTNTSELRITHKISKESLNVQGAARQKVKLATKLFSHTISMAITRCGTMGILKQPNWVECADFFKLVWIFN